MLLVWHGYIPGTELSVAYGHLREMGISALIMFRNKIPTDAQHDTFCSVHRLPILMLGAGGLITWYHGMMDERDFLFLSHVLRTPVY